MRIFINGKETILQDGQTVTTLVEHLGLSGRRLAVEVNLEIISRGRHDQHALAEGDRVELIQAIGGG